MVTDSSHGNPSPREPSTYPTPGSPLMNLPIDDGRGPGEQWPWAVVDDYTPRVRWLRPAIVSGALLLGGLLLALTTPAGWGTFTVIALITICGFIASVWSQVRDPWPAWRLRNLQAADYRANRSLAEVDQDFARDMGFNAPRPDPDCQTATAHPEQRTSGQDATGRLPRPRQWELSGPPFTTGGFAGPLEE